MLQCDGHWPETAPVAAPAFLRAGLGSRSRLVPAPHCLINNTGTQQPGLQPASGQRNFLTRSYNILVLLLARRDTNLSKAQRKQQAEHSPGLALCSHLAYAEPEHSWSLAGRWQGLDLLCSSEEVLQELPNRGTLLYLPLTPAHPPSEVIYSPTEHPHPPRKLRACLPWCVDPDDVQVTEVNAFLI